MVCDRSMPNGDLALGQIGQGAVKILPLHRVIASKRAANREKDVAVLQSCDALYASQAVEEASPARPPMRNLFVEK